MVKKISVIGGAGFVGTNLCQSLAERQVPFEIIDLRKSNQFPEKSKIADVRNINSLRETITGDVIVNLAAVHRDDVREKSDYFDTNVTGAENITKVCSELGISKIVFTSSVAVYGFAEPGTGEEGEIKPFNEYGRTKFLAEEKLRAWQNQTGSSLTIVRPTVIFGEGNRGNVYNLLNQIASGRFVMIGNGKNKKSMAYIENIIAFMEECISSDETYGVYNYVDSPDIDMNTLVQNVRSVLKGKKNTGLRLPYLLGILLGYVADVLSKLSGANLPISSIRVRKFCSNTSFSSAKFELNNFEAPFSLEQGLAKTIQREFVAPDPSREVFYTE